MRRSKSETIAEYRDKFLSGKSEDYVNKFNQKNENQQYIAIANWKRQAKALGEATGDLAKVTMANVVTSLKEAQKHLVKMTELSPKQAAKVQSLLDSVRTTIDNFDIIKKQQLLAALQKEKEELAKKNNYLENQIEQLKQQLGK